MSRRTVSRSLAAVVTVGLLASSGLALTAEAASAKPSAGTTTARPARKLGPVQNLAVAVTKPSAYRLAVSWDALTGAASYKTSLTNTATGTVITTGSVTSTSWVTTTTLPVLTQVTVKVTPVAPRRHGVAASYTTTLPDVTAPTGSFTVGYDTNNGYLVTLTQTSLSDDVVPLDVTRTVTWGDGSPDEAWTTGTTISHTYGAQQIFDAQVLLSDAAHNTTAVPLAVVVGDTTGPTGSFTATVPTGTTWAKVTPVTLTQTALHDDFSAATDITREIDWTGSGTTFVPWTGTGLTTTHVYSAAGTYTPTVRITDQHGNPTTIATTPVTVTADTVAPTARLAVPRLHRTWVASWTTLKGTANDSGTGVRNVRVRVIEKRGTAWYAYKAPTRTWVKAGTKAAALSKSRPATVRPTATHTWSTKVAGLRKGSLLVRVWATDRAGNASALKSYAQLLSHR